ncbi:MAG: hypothetical protein ACI35O_13945 [Bacillaceae bacterium]
MSIFDATDKQIDVSYVKIGVVSLCIPAFKPQGALCGFLFYLLFEGIGMYVTCENR